MAGDGLLYQEKQKKITLVEELQNEFAKEQKLTNYAEYDSGYHTKTRKGYAISRKLEGLELFKKRVKAQGAVVAADMLTAEAKDEYRRKYNLSSKELERMLVEMQQGYVEDFRLEENEYGLMQTKVRSDDFKKTHADHSKVYEELGEVLYEKRKAQNLPSFQLATLEKDAAKDFIKRHHLSEKELKKIYLDIQTHAVSVEKYRTYSTIEEDTLQRRRVSEQKRAAEEYKQQEIDRIAGEVEKNHELQGQLQEQNKAEDAEKRRVRRLYLETGITLEATPVRWEMAEYADAAERYLAEQKGDILDMDEVVKAVSIMQKNLQKNRELLKEELKEQIKTYEKAGLPLFLSSRMMDELTKEYEKKHIGEMFDRDLAAITNITARAEELLDRKEEQLENWSRRGKRIQSEIGKDRIQLSNMKNQILQELYLLPKEKFEEKIKLLSKQAEFNLSHVDMVIEEHVTVVNRERLFHQIQERFGEQLIFGAPADIYDIVHNYMENMPQEIKSSEENAVPAIAYFYDKLVEAATEFGIRSSYMYMDYTVWEKLVKRAVDPGDNLETMKRKLQYMATNMAANLEKFRRTYSDGLSMGASAWDELYVYRDSILDAKPKDFIGLINKKLQEEILVKFRKEDGTYDYGTQGEIDFQRHYQVWSLLDGIDDAIMYKENFTNVERLKGKELLKHPEFEFAFRGRENMFLHVLYEALEDGDLKLDCLEGIRHYQDLDLLSYSDMEMVLHLIRTNIRGCTRRWGNIIGPFAEKIQENMLKDMIRGRLRPEEIEDRIKQEEKKLKDTYPKIRKLRTRFLLSVDQKASCSNIGAEKIPQDCYYARNQEKFADAKRTWEILRENGLERKAMLACMKYCKNPYTEDFGKAMEENPAGELKELLDYEVGTREAKRLADKLSRGRTKNFMHEMLWCGREERFLNRELNPFIHEIMTKKRQKNETDEQDRNAAAEVLRTMYLLTDTINELGLTPAHKEYEEYREKVFSSAMVFVSRLTGLKVGDKRWERYYAEEAAWLKATGVKNIWEMCDQIKLHHKKRDAKRGFWEDINNKELDEDIILENQKELYGFLQEYENGILIPVIPDLLNDDEFWISMGTLEKEEFKVKIDNLIPKIRLPLEIIKERYSSLGADFYEEICGCFGKEILQGKDYDKVKWLEVFDDFFRDYSDRRLGGFSIVELTAKLKKENSQNPVIPYVTEILLSNKDGIGLAGKPEELKKVLEEHRKRIQPNLELLKKEIDGYLDRNSEEFGKTAAERESQKEAFRKGCLMYMQTKVIYTEPEEFAQRLAAWMLQYRNLRTDTQEDNQKATEAMERRREKFADVMEHRDAGIRADGMDFTAFRNLKKGMRRSGSPLQLALKTKSHATAEEIKKAKETVQLAFSELPQAVQDYLLERSLSGAGEGVLQKEAKWLQEAYDLAKNHIDQLQETEKSQIPDPEKMVSEILLYSYIKQLEAEKTDRPVENTLIQKSYEELKYRHGRLSALLDQKYNLTVEYQPVYRKIEEDSHKIKKAEENPVLSGQRHLVVEAMAAGLYIMDESVFEELVGGQEVFLRNAEKADIIFEKAVKEHNVPVKEQLAMRQALIDYFRAEFIQNKEVDLAKLQIKTDQLLEDDVYRSALLSSVMMEEMGDDVLSRDERTMVTTANRQTLEEFLQLRRNTEYRVQYNGLTRLQRQVFALSVLEMEEEAKLPSMQFVISEELQKARSVGVAKDLEDYIRGRTFLPQIAYDRVMDRLQKVDGTMNRKIFLEALKKTEEYSLRRQENMPKNWKLLNDADFSLKEANRLRKQDRPMEEPEIAEPAQLKNWILNQDEKMTKKVAEKVAPIKARLKELNDFQIKQLALVLGDRTMADHTTEASLKGKQIPYVNEKKRRYYKDVQSVKLKVSVEDLKKAAKMLQGYQLNDSVKMVYREMTKEDFAPDALKRETKIDWDLLSRAMDLAKEVE